jgi:hypothetical protein
MHSIIRKISLTLLTMLPMAGVWAQASAPAAPEAVLNLSKFNGTWQANMTSTMGDKTYQYDYTVICKPIAGGNGAYWEESATVPEMGDMHSSDLFGFDRADGKLHCYSVDNMGATKDQICEWKSPDHLVVQFNGTQNGKPVREQYDLTLQGDNTLEFTGSSILDGKKQWSGSGTFKKIEDNK